MSGFSGAIDESIKGTNISNSCSILQNPRRMCHVCLHPCSFSVAFLLWWSADGPADRRAGNKWTVSGVSFNPTTGASGRVLRMTAVARLLVSLFKISQNHHRLNKLFSINERTSLHTPGYDSTASTDFRCLSLFPDGSCPIMDASPVALSYDKSVYGNFSLLPPRVDAAQQRVRAITQHPPVLRALTGSASLLSGPASNLTPANTQVRLQ